MNKIDRMIELNNLIGPGAAVPYWPPKKGDRARYHEGRPVTFTGEQNASGGWNVERDGEDQGGLSLGAFKPGGGWTWVTP